MTIADFVQQVLYAIYKVRLDVTAGVSGAFHADTDKFKEVLMEANFVLQEMQKDQEWSWLRQRWNMGTAACDAVDDIMEFTLPDEAYKVCMGYNDAVRLHDPGNYTRFIRVPFTSPGSGNATDVAMFDTYGRVNVPDTSLRAFVLGRTLTFNRPFTPAETGLAIETDVITRLEPFHICDSDCTQPCPEAYENRILLDFPDPYYLIVRTAAKRAEGDPSVADRAMTLDEEAKRILSGMRENDSAKTIPESYTTLPLGYTRVL